MRIKEEYLNMPYTWVVQERDDDTGHYFYGKILELDGCQSSGETLDELYANLQEAMEGYIELKLERNLPIPEPKIVDEYSGKFNIRIPKSLHKRLATEAAQEGVSLNQYALYKLSQA